MTTFQEGYWTSKNKPTHSETPWEGKEAFLSKLNQMERIAETKVFKGTSVCRVCKKPNGSETFYLGDGEWPSGYSHYIRQHNHRPSSEFLDFVENFRKPRAR